MIRMIALPLAACVLLPPVVGSAASQSSRDSFTTQDCSNRIESLGPDYVVNNRSALPVVGKRCNRYYAELTDNKDNKTVHYHKQQGRFDGKLVTFPFEVIVRNIGIGTLRDSQTAPRPTGRSYVFAGVQVHVNDFKSINSSHVVVGHRGKTTFTVEGKNTVNGRSKVNDVGAGTAPAGRADLRVVGNADKTLRVYWQTPNPKPGAQSDNWKPYNGSGRLPGRKPAFGQKVYVGLITYAYHRGNIPFVGTADSFDIIRSGSQ